MILEMFNHHLMVPRMQLPNRPWDKFFRVNHLLLHLPSDVSVESFEGPSGGKRRSAPETQRLLRALEQGEIRITRKPKTSAIPLRSTVTDEVSHTVTDEVSHTVTDEVSRTMTEEVLQAVDGSVQDEDCDDGWLLDSEGGKGKRKGNDVAVGQNDTDVQYDDGSDSDVALPSLTPSPAR
jgi:hypothetical protein